MYCLIISDTKTWLFHNDHKWTTDMFDVHNVKTVQYFNIRHSNEPTHTFAYNRVTKRLDLTSYQHHPDSEYCSHIELPQIKCHTGVTPVVQPVTPVVQPVTPVVQPVTPTVPSTPQPTMPNVKPAKAVQKPATKTTPEIPTSAEELERLIQEKKQRQRELERKLKQTNKQLKEKEEVVNKARMEQSLERRAKEREEEKIREAKRVFENNKALFWRFYRTNQDPDESKHEVIPPMFEMEYDIFESLMEENILTDSKEFNEDEFKAYKETKDFIIEQEREEAAKNNKLPEGVDPRVYTDVPDNTSSHHALFGQQSYMYDVNNMLGRPVRKPVESESDSDTDDIHTDDDSGSVSSIEY